MLLPANRPRGGVPEPWVVSRLTTATWRSQKGYPGWLRGVDLNHRPLGYEFYPYWPLVLDVLYKSTAYLLIAAALSSRCLLILGAIGRNLGRNPESSACPDPAIAPRSVSASARADTRMRSPWHNPWPVTPSDGLPAYCGPEPALWRAVWLVGWRPGIAYGDAPFRSKQGHRSGGGL